MFLGVAAVLLFVQWSGAAEGIVGRPAPLALDGPIFTVETIVEEPAKGNLLGRDVALWGVPVTEVPGDWLFWVASESGRVVPVVLMGEQAGRQHEYQTRVREGDTLAIFGIVRAVREVSLLDRRWAMQPDDWKRLARAQVYVSALRVEHLGARLRPVRP